MNQQLCGCWRDVSLAATSFIFFLQYSALIYFDTIPEHGFSDMLKMFASPLRRIQMMPCKDPFCLLCNSYFSSAVHSIIETKEKKQPSSGGSIKVREKRGVRYSPKGQVTSFVTPTSYIYGSLKIASYYHTELKKLKKRQRSLYIKSGSLKIYI